MKTYILQKDATGRQFIADALGDGCEAIKSCEAANWRFAKAHFAGTKWTDADEAAFAKDFKARFPEPVST